MAFASRQFYPPTGRLQAAEGASLAAANDLLVPDSADSVTVTGNTTINGIYVGARPTGAMVILRFTGTPTVKHNTAASAGYASLLLSGGADFSATANDTLVLQYNGTTYQQVGGAVI